MHEVGPIPALFWAVPVVGVLTLLFVAYLIKSVLSRDKGTKEMQEIGDMIFQGAKAFLKRQYTTIAIISLVIAVVIGLLVGFLQGEAELEALGKGKLAIGLLTGVAFLVGAFCSAISGYIGMWVSVKCNVRCASAARYGIKGAIDVAIKGGAVSGFLIVALSLIGVSVMYFA